MTYCKLWPSFGYCFQNVTCYWDITAVRDLFHLYDKQNITWPLGADTIFHLFAENPQTYWFACSVTCIKELAFIIVRYCKITSTMRGRKNRSWDLCFKRKNLLCNDIRSLSSTVINASIKVANQGIQLIRKHKFWLIRSYGWRCYLFED